MNGVSYGGLVQLARTTVLQAVGHEFESRNLHYFNKVCKTLN